MSDLDPTATPLQRRMERQRARRRRQVLWAIPVLVLVAVAVAVIVNRSGSNSRRVTGARSAAGSAPSSGSPTDRSTSPGVRNSSATGTSSRATSSATTTTKPLAQVPVALPPADLKAPPDPPVGYYRNGKLYLEGSVPTDSAGAGYLRKSRAVLGAGNVIMDMKLDPRAPVGPARVIVEEQFQFPTGSSVMDPKFAGLLAVGAYALKRLPESTLVINGYTDNVGPPAVNVALSKQRAQLVVDFMVAHGIPANRIIAVGRGDADPIGDNATPEGRQKNRRIEGTLEGIMPFGP